MIWKSVDESELLFNKTSSKEFLAILSDVGTALTEVIKCPHLLMCYEGAGSFLCITRDPDLPEWDAIEEALQEKLDIVRRLAAMMHLCPSRYRSELRYRQTQTARNA